MPCVSQLCFSVFPLHILDPTDTTRKIRQALALQASLLELVERVEAVRAEHERLEGGNRFLQSYIGELMQTSKLTAVTGSGVSRSGSRRTPAAAKGKGAK